MSAALVVDGLDARRCSKCSVEKPLVEFYPRRKGSQDRLPYCRDCDNAKPRTRGVQKLIAQRARHRAVAELIKRHDGEFRDLLTYFTATVEEEASQLAVGQGHGHRHEDEDEGGGNAPRLKPGKRRAGQTAKQRIDIARCSHCIRNHDRGHACPKCGTIPTHALSRANDGIVDEIAVERRMNGEPVALTADELALAARRLAHKGLGVSGITRRLRMSGERVAKILAEREDGTA